MSSSMSLLLRPPALAAATRRGGALEGPLEPKSPPPSSPPKLPPPPPPLRPSSMVRVELKFCSTTSVEYFSAPCWSVHLRVCNWPSIYTLAPFFSYCSATLQSPSLKITTRCHSVFSLRSPVALSRQVSEVATLRLAIGRPSCVRRISGSLPRLPTRITLFTLPAIAVLQSHFFRRRPYTLVLRLRLLALPVIPTYSSFGGMFQFCSRRSSRKVSGEKSRGIHWKISGKR